MTDIKSRNFNNLSKKMSIFCFIFTIILTLAFVSLLITTAI